MRTKLLSIFLILLFATFAPAQSKSIVGNWLGILEIQGFKIRLQVKVTATPDGKLKATFDSLDQGATDLPVETVTFEANTFRFNAPNYSLSYEGKLSVDGNEIAGEFKQGSNPFPLTFKRVDKPTILSKPQDPQKPYPYAEEEVTYENTVDKVKLAGTLTLPPSKTPVPGVILITGSGSQDRNETIMGHRPFLVLADHLTRRGIAVLRVDDRGIGGSGTGAPNATSQNYAGDVLAGVTYLKTRKEVDPKRIGLIGHSEGGMIAPMVATKSPDVAFIVMMAGLGQTGRDVVLMQGDLMSKTAGVDAQTIANVRRVYAGLFDILKADKDNAVAEKKMRDFVAKEVAAMDDAQKKNFETVLKQINAQLTLYSSDWFRYFLLFDPAPVLEKVKVPVLAIVGEKDLQVPAKENMQLIEAALKKGGNKNYSVLILPGLNHVFQTAKTGLPTEYGSIEETISPTALNTISDWILKTVNSKR